MLNHHSIIVLVLLLNAALFAQDNLLKGYVVSSSGEPLEAVNVYLEGTVVGAATDREGYFRITNLPMGEFYLRFSIIGFQLHQIKVMIQNQDLNVGKIILQPVALQSQPIIVTAARREQTFQDLSVSVGNVTRQEIEYRNTVTVDDALKYVSGLNITGSQINIRGSSGYSRGVGSRVLTLIDGIPFLTGDTKETNFESIQINQIERIEIVKGAGSALYGSSAIGGVINIINKRIGADPQLNVKLYGGMYTKVHYPEWKWSDRTRYLSGMRIDYSNKTGNLGYRISATHDQDDSYKQNDWMKRYYFSTMLEYSFSPFDELRLNGTFMKQHRASFLYWKNLENALIPPEDQLGNVVNSRRWHLSGNYRHVFNQNRFYTIKAIWYQNHFDDNIEAEEGREGNRSTSDYWNAEFQYNWSLENHLLTTGIDANLSQVSSDIFSDKKGYNAALFTQDEIQFSPDWSVTPGLRIDYYSLDEIGTDIQINPKLGAVYKPWPGAAFRGSAGRGFRAPSIGEVFINTTASGLKVIPNPSLTPEKSMSGEIGYNHFLGKKIFVDIAVFYNRYWNLIEASFIESGEIQFRNVTDAQSIGMELNFSLSEFNDKLSYEFGYTYVNSRDLQTNEFLAFRPRHLFYNHLGYKWHEFTIGADYRFISAWDRIDESLKVFVRDANERIDAHVLDLRVGATFPVANHSIDLTVQMNNLLQYHYLDLVGSIAPIRNFVLTIAGSF